MRYFLQFILLLGLLSLNSASFAKNSDFNILPSISISNRQFDYVSNDNTVAGDIVTGGLGLSLTYQRFYADFKVESNLSSQNENASNLVNIDNAISFKRRDFTLSTGYALENTFILFVGYKRGETTIDSSRAGANNSISLTGKGFFLGAGAGAQIRDWGLLSFSAAYADLNAEYQDNFTPTIQGNASGTSLSLSWKAAVNKNLDYNLALIRHDYAYAGFPRSNFRIQENILSLRFSLAYHF